MITFLDKQVGRLLSLLDELNLRNDTVVFFTSDNGTTFLEPQVDYEFFESVGPLKGLKGSVYEGGIRVPMIVRWPGHIEAGRVTDLAAAHYDALATIADLAGVVPVDSTDGISYVPTMVGQDERQEPREYLFWDFAGYKGQLAVRLGNWKGVKRELRKNPDAPLELYDLTSDIGEQNNVVEAHPEVARQIEEIMLDAREKPRIERFQFGRYRDE
jgi:arylsulfatase A-like enzyme